MSQCLMAEEQRLANRGTDDDLLVKADDTPVSVSHSNRQESEETLVSDHDLTFNSNLGQHVVVGVQSRPQDVGAQVTVDINRLSASSAQSQTEFTPVSLQSFTPEDITRTSVQNTPQARIASDLLGKIIHNELPINLISLQEKKLLSRARIWEKTRGAVIAAVDPTKPWEDQEHHIRCTIKHQLTYSVLSHRWLPKGEVTFEDLQPSTSFLSEVVPEGQDKLRNFCAKSKTFGCTWAWADTCCINKRSSSELEESIRSMYRWYRNASVCIVYLRDTHSLQGMAADSWFTRGWTLQELLAPERIKFFNAKWKPLLCHEPFDIDRTQGTRPAPHDRVTPLASTEQCSVDEFLAKIHEITGIPTICLKLFEARTNMIAEKMTWASSRSTTRVEDAAYCLIGLFNVDLTIAYGEGERAFYRLQKAIMEQSSDSALFKWAGSLSTPHSMFAKSAKCFSVVDPDCHLVSTLKHRHHNADKYSQYYWEQIAIAMLPRGGREFVFSNAGLSVQLVLYNVTAVTIVGQNCWNVWADGIHGHNSDRQDGRFEVTAKTNHRLHATGFHETLYVGVLDYETEDARGNPRAFEDEFYTTWNTFRYLIPEDRNELARDILKARETRRYTAILLYLAIPGKTRPFERIPTEELFQVQRPRNGWRHPSTIYVR